MKYRKEITDTKKHKKYKYNIKKFKVLKKNIVIFKKTNNNIFLTVTNKKGEVLVSVSAGKCKIKSKKKKKSFDTVKSVASLTAKLCLIKNIKFLQKFYITHSYMKYFYIIYYALKNSGIFIKEVIYIKKRSHSLALRKRKIRRI